MNRVGSDTSCNSDVYLFNSNQLPGPLIILAHYRGLDFVPWARWIGELHQERQCRRRINPVEQRCEEVATTEVRNDSKARANVVVRTRVLDSTGKVIKTTQNRLRVPANQTNQTEQTLTVRSPKLWSPNSPELYSAEVEIVSARRTVDAVTTRFGIRKIEKQPFILEKSRGRQA